MSAADPNPPCVLIAEGDPWVREMLSEMLLSVRCDARLQVCADGSQALTALASKPDLIIAARELAGSMASTCCARCAPRARACRSFS